jgi:hypothetical protein
LDVIVGAVIIACDDGTLEVVVVLVVVVMVSVSSEFAVFAVVVVSSDATPEVDVVVF